MKKMLLMALMALLTIVAQAQYNTTTVVNGLRYYVDTTNKSAAVAPADSTLTYQGVITIPEVITVDNTSYQVVAIYKKAFAYNTDISMVSIPKSVTTIADSAFFSCLHLTSVRMEGDVQYIGNSAFGNLIELCDFYCFGESIPQTAADAFKGTLHTTDSIPSDNILIYTDPAFSSFTTYNVNGYAAWSQGVSYTQATGYQAWNGASSKSNVEVESYLISPALNTKCASGKVRFCFDQTLRYTNSVSGWENYHKIFISKDYNGNTEDFGQATWTQIAFTPEASPYSDWTIYSSGYLQVPDEFVNHDSVYIAFYFYAPTTASTTWELENFLIEEGIADNSGSGGGDGPSINVGTKEAPFTVAEAKTKIGNSGYVKGYIVGYVDGSRLDEGAKFETATESQTELLLADSPTETNPSNVLPVQLPEGDIRTNLNPAITSNIGKQVILYGSFENYFGTPGMKFTSWAEINGQTYGTDPDETPVPAGEQQGDGTQANPYNVAAAIAFTSALPHDQNSDAKYIVGIICNDPNIDTDQYGYASFYISDDGTDAYKFYIYRIFDIGNQNFTDASKIKKGDKVIVYSPLVNFRGISLETAENQGCLISVNDSTEGGGGSGDDTPPTFGPGSTDGINISGTTVTLTNAGTTAGTESISVDLSTLGYSNAEEVGTVTLGDGTTVTFAAGTNKNAPKYYTATNGVRVYANNTITFVGTKLIATVVMECDSYNGTDYVGDTTATLSAGGNILVYNASSTAGTQLRIQTITITYAQTDSVNAKPVPAGTQKGDGTQANPYNVAVAFAFTSALLQDQNSDASINISGTTVTLTNTGTTAGAESISVDFSTLGYDNAEEVGIVTLDDGTTVTFAAGTNSIAPRYYTTTNGVRVYANNTITFVGRKLIATVVMECDSLNGTDYVGNATATLSADGDTLVYNNARSTTNTQLRVKTITITYAQTGSVSRLTTLHVPEALVEHYQMTAPWSQFGYVVALTDGDKLNNGDMFTATTAEGVVVAYKVLSAIERTCQVGCGELDLSSAAETLQFIPAVAYDITGNVTIPDRIEKMGYTVTGIANGAFNNCKELISVEIPSSITRVEDRTFVGCQSLAAVVWDADVALPSSTLDEVNNPNLLLYITSAQYAANLPQNTAIFVVGNTVETFRLSQSHNFYVPRAFDVAHIDYTHNFTMQSGYGQSRGWETLTLPFAPQTINHETAGTIVPFAQYADYMSTKPFWLNELTADGWKSAERIEPNKPYIISMPNNSIYPAVYCLGGQVTFAADHISVPKTEIVVCSGNGYQFVSTTLNMEQSDNVYAVNRTAYQTFPEGSVFVRGQRTISAFEAYLTMKDAGARYIPIYEDMTTGMIPAIVTQESQQSGTCYTLQGVAVKNPAAKGVYIKDGKKVFLK